MADTVPYSEIGKLIPEKPSCRMIDRLSVDPQKGKASAIKAVSIDEPYFQGHFPQTPIMPGVLQIAAMTQLSGALLSRIDNCDLSKKIPVVRRMHNIKFRNPVRPGDLMTVETEQDTEQNTLFHANARVGDKMVCQGKLELELQERSNGRQLPQTLTPNPTVADKQDNDIQRDIRTIMQAIPHRYPFLFIDRILELDDENLRIAGLKNLTGNESVFQGTPEPVLPESVQCEIAAQTGCTLALTREGNEDKIVYFMSINDARFYHRLVPGDQVMIDMQASRRGRYGRADGNLLIGENIASTISLKFAVVDQ